MDIRNDPELKRVFDEMAQSSFGVSLRPEQSSAIVDIFSMANGTKGLYPSAYLLIQRTGGGKSLVRNMLGRALRGVTWTLTPLLALSADQVASMKIYIENSEGDPFMKTYNLDTYNGENDINGLKKDLMAIGNDTKKFISIFASPGRMSKDEWMIELFLDLLNKGTLRLFCVDEIHEAINQALFYRKSNYSKLIVSRGRYPKK